MAITLLKRLESSAFSFNLTLSKIIAKIENAISKVENYMETKAGTIDDDISSYVNANIYDFDDDDADDDMFQIGGKIVIDIADMDYRKWLEGLKADLEMLKPLKEKIETISVEHDKKFNNLKQLILDKINNPINNGNKKILIFTAFSDTADYLYENLSNALKKQYNIDIGEITGKGGKATCGKNMTKPNEIMMAFSPISKEREMISPNDNRNIEILIGTDCISEGQNLQDCDYMVNYDIHWNPVRIIQRFGRIDRIGSLNSKIQLINFWPPVTLDEYLDLKGRVESRMKIVVIGGAGVGEDNIIDPEEISDLQYRKKQLENLKNEIVDMEDMTDGISITDLGLNDFRMDLIEYVEKHKEIKKMPLGLNAVVKSDDFVKEGVIYILKNINKEVNIDNQNLLHPYYLVYMSMNGKVIYNHLQPKQILDVLKYSCKSINEPEKELCEKINFETSDGRKMEVYSNLLSKAVESIVEKKNRRRCGGFYNWW